MKIHFLIVFSFLTALFHFSLAQNISIGEPAENVAGLVKLEIDNYYRAQGYHQIQMDYDVRYSNGRIVEVILYKGNVPALDLQKPVNFFVRYLMNTKGELERVLTQYENVSLEELKRFTKGELIVNDYYFEQNLKYVTQLYLGSNGLATKDYRMTILSEMPESVRSVLKKYKPEYYKGFSHSNKKSTNKNGSIHAWENEKSALLQKIGEKFLLCGTTVFVKDVAADKPTSTYIMKIPGLIKGDSNDTSVEFEFYSSKNPLEPCKRVNGYISNGVIYTYEGAAKRFYANVFKYENDKLYVKNNNGAFDIFYNPNAGAE